MYLEEMKRSLLFMGVLTAVSLTGQTTFTCTSTGTVCGCTSGVTASYYSGYFNDVQTYFTSNTPGLTRTEGNVNYTVNNWGSIVPPAGGTTANPETFSTRFSGRIYLAAGTYTFYLTSDDGAYLWLGANALVTNPTTATSFINNGGLHSPATVSAVAIIPSNCLMDFKIHYGENTGDNRCALEYASTGLGIARRAVPNSVLCSCMSSGPLPIGLLDFSAKYKDGNLRLHWSTATETNNHHFTVYRSEDGRSWSVLKEVPGAGTSTVRNDYSIIDPDPSAGVNYYYLEQTDKDGTSEKFSVIVFDLDHKESFLKVYPNPFQDKCVVLSSSHIEPADVSVYTCLGKPVSPDYIRISDYKVEIITTELQPGSYYVKVKTPDGYIVRRLFKN